MISIARNIPAAPPQVWESLGDLDRWAEMLPTINAITRLDDPPTVPGSRFRVRQPGMPAATYVVTAWRPAVGFTWEVRSAGVTATATHELVAQGSDHTLLRLGLAWTGPMAWLHRWLFTGKARSFVASEADTFAALATAARRTEG